MTERGWICRSAPSDEAWRHSGDVAARILENLAQRDARAAAERLTSKGSQGAVVEAVAS